MTKRRIQIDRDKLAGMVERGFSLRQCASWLKVSEVRIRCELDDMGLKTANKPPVPKGTKRGSYGGYGMPRPLMSEKRIAEIYDGRRYA